MNKEFVVYVREVHTQPYKVKARSAERARQLIAENTENGDILEAGFEYQNTLPANGQAIDYCSWTVKPYKKEEWK